MTGAREPYLSIVEWQWKRPLAVILRFAGRSIDEVAGSPRAAAEVRLLWRTYRAGERLADRRAEEHRIETELWWRAMGSPVTCPLCGAREACDCAPRNLPRPAEREWLPAGEARF